MNGKSLNTFSEEVLHLDRDVNIALHKLYCFAYCRCYECKMYNHDDVDFGCMIVQRNIEERVKSRIRQDMEYLNERFKIYPETRSVILKFIGGASME